METLLIGYGDGLVRASVNDTVKTDWVMRGAPVPMVVPDPVRGERLYAATLGQGLWRSNDGGTTFERLDSLDAGLVWSVAVSASDRHGDYGTVYAGTQMSALFKSTDGGETFAELESVQDISSRPQWSFPPAPDTHHVHQITLDVHDPNVVLFGVELGGVYRSTDAGATWVRTTADPDPHTLRTHPTAPGRMYQGGGAAYYESHDGGETWARDLSGIAEDVRYFYSLAVDSGEPENVLLVGARDPFSGHAVIPGIPVWSSLYRRSGRSGDGWTPVTDGTPPVDGTPMGTLAAGSAGVFYYVTDPGEIYRSGDGGRSFVHVDYGDGAVRGNVARAAAVIGW